MVLEINPVARGLLECLSKPGKEFIKSVNFSFAHSQVVVEINSVARGFLTCIERVYSKQAIVFQTTLLLL